MWEAKLLWRLPFDIIKNEVFGAALLHHHVLFLAALQLCWY